MAVLPVTLRHALVCGAVTAILVVQTGPAHAGSEGRATRPRVQLGAAMQRTAALIKDCLGRRWPRPKVHAQTRDLVRFLTHDLKVRGRYVAPTKVVRYRLDGLGPCELQVLVARIAEYAGSPVRDFFNIYSRLGEGQSANLGALGRGHSRVNRYQGQQGNVVYRIGVWAYDSSGRRVRRRELRLFDAAGNLELERLSQSARGPLRFSVHLYGEEVGWTDGSTASRIRVGQDAPLGHRVHRPWSALPLAFDRGSK